MNRWPKLLVVPFLVLFLFAGGAMADNITIWDGNGIGENDTYGLEDGETEPGMDQSQVWDLEAFLLEGTMLTMVGGYDFESGEESGSKTFYSGDLFIGRDVKYGKDAATASVGSKKNDFMSNVFGYEYAIDFNFVPDTNSYAVYKINQILKLRLLIITIMVPLIILQNKLLIQWPLKILQVSRLSVTLNGHWHFGMKVVNTIFQ